MPSNARALAKLEADGLLRRDGTEYRSTRRWQSAMARAAFHLFGAGDSGDDLRTPIAYALVELYGRDISNEEIAQLVMAMAPVEARELNPREHLARAR